MRSSDRKIRATPQANRTVADPSTEPNASLQQRLRGLAHELSGGTAASLIVLTQAMAFGVALYEPYVHAPASAALAGLICAISLSLCSSLARGTVGLVSAPTGPVLVMLAAIAATLAGSGLRGHEVIFALNITVALAGVMQVIIGALGGGRIIKLVPVPVIAGFMTGSGILMIASQIGPATGNVDSLESLRYGWLPVVTTAGTLTAMAGARRWLPRIPTVVPGIVLGCVVFHGLAFANQAGVQVDWMVGALPVFQWDSIEVSALEQARLPWLLIAVSALFLAAFTALDTLLTSLIADVETGERHDARRELLGQGIGLSLSGLLGGIAGAGTTGATVAAIRNGARSFAGAFCAAAVAATLIWGRNLTEQLPISVLAGVIIFVAIGLLEQNIIVWWQRNRTRTDALIAVLVALVTVSFDLMLAVALGMLITVMRFVAAQIQAPVVQQRITASRTRSWRVRNSEEQIALDEHGQRIVLFELRGTLVFATAERLYEQILGDIEAGHRIVLSLRRVTQVDITGISLLRNMCNRAKHRGGEIVFANVHKRSGLNRKVAKSFRRIGLDSSELRVRTFKSSDVALEHLENELLEELGVRTHQGAVLVQDCELCTDLDDAGVQSLSSYLEVRESSRGKRIYEAGQPGGAIYIVLRGSVDIRLRTGRHHWSRIARIGPGMIFGEVSFHTPGKHTATAVATQATQTMTLHRAEFDRMAKDHPELAVSLLATIGRVLGRRLRQANLEILRLNHF